MKTKQLNSEFPKYESNILFYFGIGFIIFTIMLTILFLTTHFNNFHTQKTNGINTAKIEIYAAHLECNIMPKINDSTITVNLANAKNNFKELLLDKHWFSSMLIISNEQKKEINTILKQLKTLEELSKQEYTAISKPKCNAIFYSLLNNINHLQIDLNKRYLQHRKVLHYARVTIIIFLLIFIIGVFYIATKRKSIREKLLLEAQKSNYFLQEAQKLAKLLTYSYDFTTKKYKASGNFFGIIGFDLNSGNLKDWADRIHPEDKQRMSNIFDKRIQNSSIEFDENYRVINKITGETHWVHHVVQGLRKDAKGNLLPVQGVLQDITNSKLTENQINRSNTILNKVNSLILVINKEEGITYVSKGVKNLLGYTPKDMLGQGWWQHTYSDTKLAQKSKDAINQYFCNPNSQSPVDKDLSLRRIKTTGGKYKWIRWSFTKESEDSLILIGTDVTESHEKSKQFTTLTEIAHDAIILTNDKGEITEVNRAARKMFGYSKKDILGKPVTVLMPKNHREFFIKELNATNELKHIKGNSFRAGIGLTKEGVTFPIEISFNMWDDDDNRTHCAFIKNITQEEHERKVKEIIYNITKYAQERPKFEVLFPFIKDILNSVIDTTNLFVSLYDENNTKKTKSYQEYLRGNPSDTYISSHPSTKTDLEHYVFNTRKSFLYKPSSKIDNSGIESKCWIGVPLIVKQQITGVMSVVNHTNEKAYSQKDIDLLELVASTISQVLQQSKDFEKINLLNQALIQSPSIIVITSIKGKIEYVNPHFTKITGYEPNEVLGKDPSIFGSSQKDKLIIANLWKTITRGESWKGEFTNIKKDGSSFTVLSTIAPVKNDINEITHYISVQEDITEKLKLEAQFINGFIEAQEIEKQYFGQELHDGISQILSAETMYIDVLIKQNQDRINDKAKFLTKIKELNLSAANEARNIAHGLMSNQLMETGLIKAIENICTDYSNTKNIKFTYIHKNINENELPKEIKINLFRIVQEVTTNIIRHSKATKVTITFTKLQKDTLNLIIEDNGIGIDFSKTEGKPKGIGFENIKRRITLLKGTLDIDTSPNNGLSFIINIPLNYNLTSIS